VFEFEEKFLANLIFRNLVTIDRSLRINDLSDKFTDRNLLKQVFTHIAKKTNIPSISKEICVIFPEKNLIDEFLRTVNSYEGGNYTESIFNLILMFDNKEELKNKLKKDKILIFLKDLKQNQGEFTVLDSILHAFQDVEGLKKEIPWITKEKITSFLKFTISVCDEDTKVKINKFLTKNSSIKEGKIYRYDKFIENVYKM
jgi:hypothetical protein